MAGTITDGDIDASGYHNHGHAGSGNKQTGVVNQHVQENLEAGETGFVVDDDSQNIHEHQQSDCNGEQEVAAVDQLLFIF